MKGWIETDFCWVFKETTWSSLLQKISSLWLKTDTQRQTETNSNSNDMREVEKQKRVRYCTLTLINRGDWSFFHKSRVTDSLSNLFRSLPNTNTHSMWSSSCNGLLLYSSGHKMSECIPANIISQLCSSLCRRSGWMRFFNTHQSKHFPL